ncbi:CTP-dependent riboflavin kinase [Candidatus Micrarchaeota archaeon]|nr:CTP-dependent riboflavin kinase [Candidatus Micrarchaeota archaeon]
MEGERLPALLAIAKASKGGECFCSTMQLSVLMRVSQQSASRKLIELEKEGLALRKPTGRGVKIILTASGRRVLEQAFFDLKKILDQSPARKLEGVVCSGLGEGKYYMSQDGYKKQFKEKLGLSIFEGTLNLRSDALEVKEFLFGLRKIRVDGFHTPARTFGAVNAFKATLNGEKIAVIVPDRTKHDEGLVEVIAESDLRKKLGLKDGKKIVLTS